MFSQKIVSFKKRVLFILLFAFLVFVGSRINFSPLLGTENQFFTLFQFFGPIPGAFLGPVFGSIAVILSQLAEFFISGKEFTIINLFRLTPMFFAAYYFGARKGINSRIISVLIPLLSILAFVLHPVGSISWIYSMYWLIPIAIALLPKHLFNNNLLKSIGSTFTAHAVGSVGFIWAIQTTPELWIALIPVVFIERLLFASGIFISYKTLNYAFNTLIEKYKLKLPFGILFLEKAKSGSRLI